MSRASLGGGLVVHTENETVLGWTSRSIGASPTFDFKPAFCVAVGVKCLPSGQFKCPVCHRGISPSGYIEFLHQGGGFPLPGNFSAKGTKRKSIIIRLHQKTTCQSSRNCKERERRPNLRRLQRVGRRRGLADGSIPELPRLRRRRRLMKGSAGRRQETAAVQMGSRTSARVLERRDHRRDIVRQRQSISEPSLIRL